jgi:hypothetical protein
VTDEPPTPELSAAERPPAEQPPAAQPAAEQPAAEQPAAEQPPAEQPPAEQPLAAQSPSVGMPAARQTDELTDQVRTMLVALDGTPTAEHAQTYAALLARLHGALGDLDGG